MAAEAGSLLGVVPQMLVCLSHVVAGSLLVEVAELALRFYALPHIISILSTVLNLWPANHVPQKQKFNYQHLFIESFLFF